MNTLFHGDLLNFGTIIILVMVVGGGLVALYMFAESAWEMRRERQDREASEAPAAEPREHPAEHGLPRSA